MRASDILKGFIAGFAATILFHQPVLWLLYRAGVAARAPYSMAATKPFGIPSVISLAFWGGVWGIIMLAVIGRALRGPGIWPTAIAFGAIAPTLVAWLVVAPLKGQPLGAGWKPQAMVTGLAVNAAWGLGTAIFLQLMPNRSATRS